MRPQHGYRMDAVRSERPTFVSILLAATLLVGIASPALAVCPQGNMGALPVILDGVIKVRPYRSTNTSTTSPATQENCVFLENIGTTTIAASVDHQIEEPGTGLPGPWAIVSFSSINISGGDPVTCSTAGGEVATTTASFGLPAGAVTDICCFTWEAGFPGTCSELPGVGDIVNHSTGGGFEEDMPLLSYIPVGGSTCGLIGLEFALVLPLLRCLARRRETS